MNERDGEWGRLNGRTGTGWLASAEGESVEWWPRAAGG